MKIEKVEAWKCKICYSIYTEEKLAINCSKLHYIEDELEIIDANWDLEINTKYPKRILIEAGTGDAAEYVFRYSDSIEGFYEKGKGWYDEKKTLTKNRLY